MLSLVTPMSLAEGVAGGVLPHATSTMAATAANAARALTNLLKFFFSSSTRAAGRAAERTQCTTDRSQRPNSILLYRRRHRVGVRRHRVGPADNAGPEPV